MRFWKRRVRSVEDDHREARLMNAEADVRDLRSRADAAIGILNERERRNHWRESIQQMIQGAV